MFTTPATTDSAYAASNDDMFCTWLIAEQIAKFVANTGQLTAIGIIILVVTALMLLNTIEEAFNIIWRQSEARTA